MVRRRPGSADGQSGGSLRREQIERFLFEVAPALTLTCPAWSGCPEVGLAPAFWPLGYSKALAGSEGLKTSSQSSLAAGVTLGPMGAHTTLGPTVGGGGRAQLLSSCLGLFSGISVFSIGEDFWALKRPLGAEGMGQNRQEDICRRLGF